MATKAKIAFGGMVQRSVNGTNWTRMAEIKQFAIPIGQPEFQDGTTLDSEEGYREFVKGLFMVPDVSMVGNWTPDEFNACLADMARAEPTYYRITMPKFTGQTTAGYSTFTAYPIIGMPANGIADIMNIEVTLKVTGKPVWTAGA